MIDVYHIDILEVLLSELDLHHLLRVFWSRLEDGVAEHTHNLLSGTLEILHGAVVLPKEGGSECISGLRLLLHPIEEHQILLLTLKGIKNVGGCIHEAVDLVFLLRTVLKQFY
jgi:hypothetical protein